MFLSADNVRTLLWYISSKFKGSSNIEIKEKIYGVPLRHTTLLWMFSDEGYYCEKITNRCLSLMPLLVGENPPIIGCKKYNIKLG